MWGLLVQTNCLCDLLVHLTLNSCSFPVCVKKRKKQKFRTFSMHVLTLYMVKVYVSSSQHNRPFLLIGHHFSANMKAESQKRAFHAKLLDRGSSLWSPSGQQSSSCYWTNKKLLLYCKIYNNNGFINFCLTLKKLCCCC